MPDIAAIAGNQVLIMFALIAIGFTAFKLKMFTPESAGHISTFLMSVVAPAVMIVSFDRDYDTALMLRLSQNFLLGVIATAIALALAYTFVRGRSDTAKMERFAICFSNCGFMGIPLIDAVLGSDAVIYAAVAVMVFNLSQWTFGRFMLVRGGGLKESLIKIVTSPGIIGVTLGILLFVSPFRLPKFIEEPMVYVTRLNTPLAMMMVGTYVARVNLRRFLGSLRVWRASVLRLLVTGALMIPLYSLFGFPADVNMANFLVTCCPVAAVAAMFPPMLGLEAGDEGSGYIAISTLLSVGTIPLMVLLYGVFV